jgi:hypothetical protein
MLIFIQTQCLMKKLIYSLSVGSLMLSCTLTDLPPEAELLKNIPVVTSADNAFTYVLWADSYSQEREDQVSFDKEEVSMSLTITQFKRGSFTLRAIQNDGTIVFEKTYTSNMVDVAETIPVTDEMQITTNASELSASISLAIGG